MSPGIFNVELMADIMHDVYGVKREDFYKRFAAFFIDLNERFNETLNNHATKTR